MLRQEKMLCQRLRPRDSRPEHGKEVEVERGRGRELDGGGGDTLRFDQMHRQVEYFFLLSFLISSRSVEDDSLLEIVHFLP